MSSNIEVNINFINKFINNLNFLKALVLRGNYKYGIIARLGGIGGKRVCNGRNALGFGETPMRPPGEE